MQYFTNFSEYPAGSGIPSDWTNRYTLHASWSIQEDAALLGGKYLRSISSSSVREFISWNDIDSDADRADVEVLVKVKTDNGGDTNNRQNRAYVRGEGTSTSSSQYAYFTEIHDTSNFELSKYVAGTHTIIGSYSYAWSAGTWYWMRFRAIGTSLKARIWADGESEPSIWHIEVTDSDISAAGYVGLGGFTPTTPSYRHFDYFSVGTGGDTAPDPEGAGTIYCTDFSDQTTDASPPVGWTPRWHTTAATWTVKEKSGTLGGKAVENLNSSPGIQRLLSRDDVDSDGNRNDVEILLRVRASSISGAQFGVAGRAEGGETTATGYILEVLDGTTLQIVKSGGTKSVLATASVTVVANAWYWLRFRLNGTSLQGRIWVSGTTEPGTWQVSTNDASYTTGWVGIASYWTSGTRDYDRVCIGTGGLSPETVADPPAGSSLNFVIVNIIT